MGNLNNYKIVENFVRKAHEGQFRHSGEPVINHPLGVTKLLKDKGYDEKFQIVALLHDVLEDTSYGVDDLRSIVSEDIIDGVISLTKSDNMTLEESIQNAKNNVFGQVIKGADRLQNAMTTYEDKNTQEFIAGFIYKTIVYYIPALEEVDNPFLDDLIVEIKRLYSYLKMDMRDKLLEYISEGQLVYYLGDCAYKDYEIETRSVIRKNSSRKKKRNKRERDRKHKRRLKRLNEIQRGYPFPVNYIDEIYIKGYGYVKRHKPYYKRLYRGKGSKYLKKQSHKKIRRYKGELHHNGYQCHRVYDFWWMLV